LILTAHQPVYLPWLGLFHKIALADNFVWFDDVQYQKKDWNNRNKIKTKNGPIWLTVPVLSKKHFEKKVGRIKINNDLPWAKKHLKSIQFSYSKSKYFDYYYEFFKNVYNKKWIFLSDLNLHILKFFLKELKIEVPIVKLSDLKISGQKSDLVLNMCKQLKAKIYIFGGEGKNYADQEKFRGSGVEPIFQEYNHPEYQQMHGDFISHLSIIDLLFNCGPECYDILMHGNMTKDKILH
jgi:hypothetical protein|tara:strand:+ start:895 stop:1605 length:711 start_codon:yes stop_codon:yes gene_type:complete